MGRKLKNCQGETLVETLAAILIAALAAALLFTCVMASVRMNQTAQAVDERYYETLSNAERQDVPVKNAVVKTEGNGTVQSIPVNLYGGENMYSYKGAP